MNILVLRENKFIVFIENLKSENLGFYFSIFLHLFILLFAIGLPNFFEPKQIFVPNIIPIEIVNVTEVTSIPKKEIEAEAEQLKNVKVKEKKFNSSDNQEIKKIEIKEKPKIENTAVEKNITPKEDIVIKEKNDTPIELKKQNNILDIDKTAESLPTKKIKPKIKPEPSPILEDQKDNSDVVVKIKPKPKIEEFSIASMLKDLRNEKSNLKNKDDKKEEIVEDELITQEDKEISKESAQLSISEIDLLRQQLTSCWIAPAGAVIEKGMLVKISAKIKQDRRVINNSVRIVDTNIPISNSFYGPITESAMRTLLNPECIPLKLPEGKYNLWKNLTITFDYSIMKGY